METRNHVPIIIGYQQRSQIFRIYWKQKLMIASSGLVNQNGLWIKKSHTTDLPATTQDWLLSSVTPVSDSGTEIRHTKHGAWLGTAILLIDGSIP